MAGKSKSFKNVFLDGYRSAFDPSPLWENQSETGFQRGKTLAECDIVLGKDDAETAFMYYMIEGEALFWTDQQKEQQYKDEPKNGVWNAEQRKKYT
jgi:hypothetical protein